MIVKHIEFDYSFWLGPNYKNEKKPLNFKKSSTIVSNHVSVMDIMVTSWANKGNQSILASDHTKNIPFIGFNVFATEGIFCPRSGSSD